MHEKKFDAVMEALEGMYEPDLVSGWNEYAKARGWYDDMLYPMDEVDDYFCGCNASQILDSLDEFKFRDDYFYSGIYGVSSTNDIFTKVDVRTLARYIVDYDEPFGSKELRDALSDDEPDEDE